VTQITDHLADIERRIALALERSGRSGDAVTIVAVSKRQPVASIAAANAAGVTHFGENYLQEALAKIGEVDRPGIEWHFIGTIQSNKTRPIAEHFAWVETVDRARIAERLAGHRPSALGPLNVLIQLNLDADPRKGGVGREAILPLAGTIASLPQLKLRGVMCMPPANQNEAEARASFLAAAAEAERLRASGFDVDTISMGMSGDFEIAVECGATSVRIGTALFGPR
jgi:pyridoxal phosphate enzyme (YggS family)